MLCMIRGGNLYFWRLYFCIFSTGLPVCPQFFSIGPAFSSCPASAEQGMQWTETKPRQREKQPCKHCLQAKLPSSAPVFAPISMSGTCRNLQGVGFLVVAGEHPSIGLCGDCTSEVQKCQGKSSQAEAKPLVWCPWFPGTIFLSPSLQKSFQQKLENAEGCWKNVLWEW